MVNAKDRSSKEGLVRILIADADEVSSFMLQCELSKLDVAYSLSRAGKNSECVAQLRDGKPDVILCPEEQACEIASALEEAEARGAAVIVISSRKTSARHPK